MKILLSFLLFLCPHISIAAQQERQKHGYFGNLKHAFINDDEELGIFLNNPEHRNTVDYIRVYIPKCEWLKKHSFPALQHLSFYNCKLENILKILPSLKTPSLNQIGFRGQKMQGPYPQDPIVMPTITTLHIAGPIKDLNVFRILKLPALETLDLRRVPIESFEGIKHIAPTLRSLKMVRTEFTQFKGHGFQATFPVLEKMDIQCHDLKNFSLLKGMIAPKLKELQCNFSDLDFNNENVFQGLIDLQAPKLSYLPLDIAIDAKNPEKLDALSSTLKNIDQSVKVLKENMPSSVQISLEISIFVFETDKEKMLDALKTKIDPSITVKFHIMTPFP
jgi:hypothetical protein